VSRPTGSLPEGLLEKPALCHAAAGKSPCSPCFGATQWPSANLASSTALAQSVSSLTQMVPKPLRDTGRAMSENVELVRSIYTALKHGDPKPAEWADREIEFTFADGPSPGTSTGVAEMIERWQDLFTAVVRLVIYFDRDRALADLGLAE
jgi:hypothetical protein